MSERPRGWTPRIIQGGASEQSEESVPETKPEQSQMTPEKLVSKPGSTLMNDMEYFIGDINRLENVKLRMEEITEFIFDRLEGFVRNDANIDLRRQGLIAASMEELSDYILNSTESDWKTRPSFYGAVIMEYQSRIDRIGEVLGDDEEE